MASGRGLEMIYGPGELYIDPTTTSGTSGTGLGYTKDGIGIRPQFEVGKLYADERGKEQLKQVHAGADWLCAAWLLQWNSATIARLFPGLAVTGGMAYRQSVVLGTAITTVKMLWVPEDTTNVPCVYFRKAVAKIEASANMRLMLGQDPQPAAFPIVFENMSGSETATGLQTTVQIRTLANIVL